MISEFLQMFCERIFMFFTIIVVLQCLLRNGLTWTCFYGSQCIFSVATHG